MPWPDISRGEFNNGRAEGKELDMIIMIEPDEYAMDEPFDDNILLLDVRLAEDYAALHAEKAVSMPLATFGDVINIASVDDDQNVYIHCGGGSSAITAATLFKKQGFSQHTG
ncbi:MAG: rhodanese-like domain-containing protein [Taibaiella sp.]|nr:rhodanese-like domain-containing protein [Taibaiella sp.]